MSDTSSDDLLTGIEPLQGESNFYRWKSMVKLQLVSLDLWGITSGSTARPGDPKSTASSSSPTQMSWDKSSLLARCLLDRHMSANLAREMDHHETAPALWKALMDRYHRCDPLTLMKSFLTISSLNYSETSTESFEDYLLTFMSHWSDLYNRTEDADPPVVGPGAGPGGNSLKTALRILVTSDESKREFLVRSLPYDMAVFAFTQRAAVGHELDFSELYRELIRYHDGMQMIKEATAMQ